MKPAPWTQLASAQIFQNPWLSLREDTLRTETGDTKQFAIVTLPYGASTLPMDPDGNVYLTRQFRPGLGALSIETPGGQMDPGESPEVTAQRETEEEIGVAVSDMITLGSMSGLTGNIDHREYLYLAQLASVPTPRASHEEEVVEPLVVPFDQAVEWALDSTIVHGPAITLILRANEYLKK